MYPEVWAQRPRAGEYTNDPMPFGPLWTVLGAKREKKTRGRGRRPRRMPEEGNERLRILTQTFPGSSDETYVPTQEAQTRPRPWIPDADANASRPADVEASPRQGPQAPDRVSQSVASAGSPRRGRLSRSGEFDRVLRNGRSQAGREFVLYVFPRGSDTEPTRLGLSVSRKVGGAVDRNTVKRMVREAFVSERDRLPGGTDVVVIARPGARELARREGLSGIRTALGELISRAQGVMTPAGHTRTSVDVAGAAGSRECDPVRGAKGCDPTRGAKAAAPQPGADARRWESAK